MSGALTIRSVTQAQVDLRRITEQLAELQGQVATGAKAHDLVGFGGASARLLSAKGLKAAADTQASILTQLDARFGVQASALGQVSSAANDLAQAIREAVSANDGRGVGTELDLSFSRIVGALNETWNGQPLFAGERQSGLPIKINSLAELQAAVTPDDIFDEAVRRQTIDLGAGAPIELAAKASELSEGLFETLRTLKGLLDGAGGALGQPLSSTQVNQLLAIASQLESEGANFTTEEGRSGQLQKRLDDDRARLQVRSDLLTKEIGEQADANLAEVSVRLSALTVQYQASAKVFADLSQLTLLNYL